MPAGLTSGASAALAFFRSLKPYPGPFGFIPRDELHPCPLKGRLDLPNNLSRSSDFGRGFEPLDSGSAHRR
jgi:hypothetical protein